MSDTPNPDLENRLRAALAARADAVEPSPGGEAGAVARMADARRGAARRRMLLGAAAVVLVVAAVAGALVLAGDDDDRTDVATGGETTTTTATTSPPPSSDAPAMWPLPSMSVTYDSFFTAAESFFTGYLGLAGACVTELPEVSDEVGTRWEMGCGPSTRIQLERRASGWVVLGAESSAFTVTSPQTGATVGADIEVLVEGLVPGATATAKVPPLGADPAASPAVDTSTTPLGADGSWRVVLGAADGPTVLVVRDGTSATARVFTVDSAAVPAETTTTTTGPADDGAPGWPGPTSRHFDTAAAAAQAFVVEVLGFAEPALADLTEEGADAVAVYHPLPTASVATTVQLHDTGPVRGWVVTGATSPQARIDNLGLVHNSAVVSVNGEATSSGGVVVVQVRDATGTVLNEKTATSGTNGEHAPFGAQLELPDDNPEVLFVLVGEAAAGGDGRFAWAAWSLVSP